MNSDDLICAFLYDLFNPSDSYAYFYSKKWRFILNKLIWNWLVNKDLIKTSKEAIGWLKMFNYIMNNLNTNAKQTN